jgi:hypothetical protein
LAFWLLLLLPWLMLGQQVSDSAAQAPRPSQPSAYWRYDAPSPLAQVQAADVDRDGIDEYIVTTEERQVILLDATGQARWSYETPEQMPLRQISALNADGSLDSALEIALVTDTDLILLGHEKQILWQETVPLLGRPVDLRPLDHDGDGSEDILLLLDTGVVQIYEATGEAAGELLWSYPETPPAGEELRPLIDVGDADGNGDDEILLSYFDRFSRLFLLEPFRSTPRWEKSLSGRIPVLTFAPFAAQAPAYIAVGNSFSRGERVQERVVFYDSNGSEQWIRTPNKLVTALATAQLPQGPALVVGTEVGTITAYSPAGDRFWRYRPETASRAVVSISPNRSGRQENQPALAFTLADLGSGAGAAAEVVLLGSQGQEMQSFASASTSGQTRLVDSNRDGIAELLLASFGTLALTDPGTGARKNAPVWDEPLGNPQAILVADFDLDEQDELLVGAGASLYLLEGEDGRASWLQPLGGEVNQLALAPASADSAPLIVVAYSQSFAPEAGQRQAESRIELWQPGRAMWATPEQLRGTVTALAVADVQGDERPEIVVGTSEGTLLALALDAPAERRVLWQAAVSGTIEEVVFLEEANGDGREIVLTTSRNQVFLFSGTGEGGVLTYYNLHDIVGLYPLPDSSSPISSLLVATADGTLRTLSREGQETWQWRLPQGRPTLIRPAGAAFLVANDNGQLFYYDVRNQQVVWEIDNLGEIRDLYWGDLDGGGNQDLAIGTRSGDVYLYTSDKREWDSLNLSSGVFRLSGVHRAPRQQAQLVAIMENGVMQLFEAKPNRPPLLVDTWTAVAAGRYDVHASIIEEPEDEVNVELQIFNSGTRQWQTVSERRVGPGEVVFPLSPEQEEPVRYRFVFDDGSHQGIVEPAPGPAPQPLRALRSGIVLPVILAIAVVSLLLLIRQSLSTEARTRRFYNRIKQQPAATLSLLNAEYTQRGGSPDFLLSLANLARSDGNQPLANLANGLFLLAARPESALPIVNSALAEAENAAVPWYRLRDWRVTFLMVQTLLEAPTVTELSLLRPQVEQLVEAEQLAPGLEAFLRVLASLRDSERVESSEDRMVYLHEATILLQQIEEREAEQNLTVEAELVNALLGRCRGLISAEIETLRGQAQLRITLKTKQLVPQEGQTPIALEIINNGRAAAENVVVTVEDSPAYRVESAPQLIPVLSPGRSHQVDLTLAPQVDDRFRIALKVYYHDRSQQDRRMDFADMVHLLPPKRSFSPIANPYTPGSPLRGNSPLFFGREELFEFVLENVGKKQGRNALILVGQRRTGKTSLLLRLSEQMPEPLLPVYIDCQSLGVLPGMDALLHDLAWLIADALAVRGYDIEVPPPAVWHKNPAGHFQRHFIPTVRSLLPEGSTIVLVFDEFEVFENLVRDAILPPTFFSFMRHLMQHSNGLGFIFVGTRRLEEMSSDYWSILFNIALYRQIGFLSKEAALKLIREPVAPQIIYDDLALDKIWRVTAGHPYFLQLVCYTLVKRANSQATGYVTISDVNAALEEMLRLGEVHFAYIWQRSTYTERALLAAVAHLMERDVPFHPADLIQYLEQYGFRLEPAEVTAGLNRLVEREIMAETTSEGSTLYELKIGLVGLWAAQNKSLSKLYEHRQNGGNGQILGERVVR